MELTPKQKQVAAVLLQVMEGAAPHQLRYTFMRKPVPVSAILELRRLHQMRMVELTHGVMAVLEAVAATRDWGSDSNRTVTVTLTTTFDWQRFVFNMSPACNLISAAYGA